MACIKQQLPLGYMRKPLNATIIELTPDLKCLQITKLSEDYDRNQSDITQMDACIERNSLDLENLPSQSRINAQRPLDIRRDLTGKVLELSPCPECNNHIYSNDSFRKTAKELGFKLPSLPKKKNVRVVTENFTLSSTAKKV
ncbi:hypothetical protein NPIL_229511 [Nephila pilipes]|uniref:Uncharacterized protein n=1 Tax=Nephila pilipes TaxID=299642 RepID=A0A8X6Q423_NEPPI|nr:hypothetical protein NPIL_229511 [Nephila pilipes]